MIDKQARLNLLGKKAALRPLELMGQVAKSKEVAEGLSSRARRTVAQLMKEKEWEKFPIIPSRRGPSGAPAQSAAGFAHKHAAVADFVNEKDTPAAGAAEDDNAAVGFNEKKNAATRKRIESRKQILRYHLSSSAQLAEKKRASDGTGNSNYIGPYGVSS